MRSYKTEGIVIKRRNVGEADRIITIFSKKEGKIKVKAVGVRKISSRRGSHIELLNYCEMSLYKGRGMPILTEVSIKDNFSEVKDDLGRIGYAYHLCELVEGLCAEGQESKEIFDLLEVTLKKLKKADDSKELIRDFELKLLSLLGFYRGEDIKVDITLLIERILERKLKSRQLLPRFT